MAKLIARNDRYDIAFGNGADAGRHGIVTAEAGLMMPHHYLATSIWYLFTHRKKWRPDVAVGKTVVGSSLIDRVAALIGRPLIEVPAGFNGFVHGVVAGTLGLAGDEDAGASFLQRDGSTWTTEKDGIVMGLLAAEMTTRTGGPCRPV